jgi:hypothetical protein
MRFTERLHETFGRASFPPPLSAALMPGDGLVRRVNADPEQPRTEDPLVFV